MIRLSYVSFDTVDFVRSHVRVFVRDVYAAGEGWAVWYGILHVVNYSC